MKKLLAWALVENMPLDDGWTLTLPIYRRKQDAQHTKKVHLLKTWRVIPCTISYQLPTKRK